MSIGSLSSSTVSTATLASADASASAAKAREGAPTIADHVAADERQEPTSVPSATLGTLVDTYL
ncbi:hypothetical protein [Actinoplanes sp. NPDC049118]|uniref:hypothetical protein n=1 Tax=Actinoplanes sp. NPDC049118 TaxID=3155769 RepID=UPI0033F212B1